MILVSVVINIVINALASYLRAHKKEPLMWQSLLGAILQGSATWYLGSRYGAWGEALGVMILALFIGIPMSVITFLYWRRKWHAPDLAWGSSA